MSKYLGKLLLEAGSVSDKALDEVLVKYVKQSDMFYFRYAGNNSGGLFGIASEIVFKLCDFRGYLVCQYRWSVGYTVKELKGIEELGSMRDEELSLLGGRRELILAGKLDNDEDFDLLCAIQYLFKFASGFFHKVKRKKHEWIIMQKRVLGKGGRKKGRRNKERNNEEESLEDVLLRCEHNINVAVKKGILEWFLEAQKEKCKVLNLKYDKEQCLKKWDELRQEQG